MSSKSTQEEVRDLLPRMEEFSYFWTEKSEDSPWEKWRPKELHGQLPGEETTKKSRLMNTWRKEEGDKENNKELMLELPSKISEVKEKKSQKWDKLKESKL